MSVQTIPPTGSSASGSSAAQGALTGGQALDQEAFLKMLVTQLSNQDPLNPLQGHEFAAQLAQFTSVEQLLSLNQTLAGQGDMFAMLAETMGDSLTAQGEMLGLLMDSMNRSSATSLIGMSVDVPGQTVVWDGAGPAAVTFELGDAAASTQINIQDADGNVVRTLTLDEAEAGLQEIAWDGMDANGQPVPEGAYTFEVLAFDADGRPVDALPVMRGTVDRVSFGPEGVFVWVNGQPIAYNDIRSIGWPTPVNPASSAEEVLYGDPMQTPKPEAETL